MHLRAQLTIPGREIFDTDYIEEGNWYKSNPSNLEWLWCVTRIQDGVVYAIQLQHWYSDAALEHIKKDCPEHIIGYILQ